MTDSNPLPEGRQIPGVPGIFRDLAWADRAEYEGSFDNVSDGDDREVDPAPLSRLVCLELEIIDGNLHQEADAIAADDRDGPIHLVHLLAACEYAAQATGGLPGPDTPQGPHGVKILRESGSGEGIPVLAAALRRGGLGAATAEARSMPPELRYHVLRDLLVLWSAPTDGLLTEMTNEKLGVPHRDGLRDVT